MIEYRFRVPSAAVFTLYSYSKSLEYYFRVSTCILSSSSDSAGKPGHVAMSGLRGWLGVVAWATVSAATPSKKKVTIESRWLNFFNFN
jgi:hypothetical protein